MTLKRSQLEALVGELSGTERRHVDLDEVNALDQGLEPREVAELIQRQPVAGRPKLVDHVERGLIDERPGAELEDDAIGREVADQIERQELGGDADPRPALSDEVLEADLTERVDRDAGRRQRIVDVSLVRLAAG